MNELTKKKEVWGPWTTFGLVVLIGLICTILQIIAMVIWLVVLKVADPALDIKSASIDLSESGLFLSLASLLTFPFSVGLTVLFCKLRKGLRIRHYLAFKRVAAKPIFLCIGCGLLVQLLCDLLGILLKQPVPEFMFTTYKSAGSLPLLCFVICILAPISEEVIFRGFFHKSLSSTRLGAAGAIIITSLCWAVIHVQYDAFVIATIFIYGLALGIARAKTGSVLPPILMHMAINAVATVQTAIIIHG